MKDELSKLKILLGISADDSDSDELLKLILANTKLQLEFKLGISSDQIGVPPELAYISLEVAVKRYNRLKNEGMSSYTQEGESITFNANDFDEFQDDIDDWKKQNNTSVLKTIDPYRNRRWFG